MNARDLSHHHTTCSTRYNRKVPCKFGWRQMKLTCLCILDQNTYHRRNKFWCLVQVLQHNRHLNIPRYNDHWNNSSIHMNCKLSRSDLVGHLSNLDRHTTNILKEEKWYKLLCEGHWRLIFLSVIVVHWHEYVQFRKPDIGLYFMYFHHLALKLNRLSQGLPRLHPSKQCRTLGTGLSWTIRLDLSVWVLWVPVNNAADPQTLWK